MQTTTQRKQSKTTDSQTQMRAKPAHLHVYSENDRREKALPSHGYDEGDRRATHGYNLRPRQKSPKVSSEESATSTSEESNSDDDLALLYDSYDDQALDYRQHKEALLTEQFGLCNLCPRTLNEFNMEIDHIVPRTKNLHIFGNYILNQKINLQAICVECHRIKTRKVDPIINIYVDESTQSIENPSFHHVIDDVIMMMDSEVKVYQQKIREKRLKRREEALRQISPEAPRQKVVETVRPEAPRQKVPETVRPEAPRQKVSEAVRQKVPEAPPQKVPETVRPETVRPETVQEKVPDNIDDLCESFTQSMKITGDDSLLLAADLRSAKQVEPSSPQPSPSKAVFTTTNIMWVGAAAVSSYFWMKNGINPIGPYMGI